MHRLRSTGRAASAAAGLVLGALCLASSPAHADDYVLAASKAHKLQVIADGGAAWCAPALRLRLVLDSDSPESGNVASQIDMLNRLKTPITTDCKQAASAVATVIDHGKAAGTFAAAATGGWVFAAAPADQKVEVTPPPTPAAPPPAALPRDRNYYGALLRYLRDNPALVQDDGTLRLWAAYRYEREYAPIQNQEFKLQPLLQRAKADLAETIAQGDADRVTVVIDTQFGSYDFSRHVFPVTFNVTQLNLNRPCCFQSGAPQILFVIVDDLDAVTGIPMDAAAAQAFTERRTHYGYTNRSIALALTVKLDHAGFKGDGGGDAAAIGSVDSATFFSDNALNEPIFHVGADDFAKWREAKAAEKAAAAAAAAEREAELRRQQMQAMRTQYIQQMTGAPASVKLANFIGDGQLNLFSRLDNLRAARASALVTGKPVGVSMLVQAGSGGRSAVAATWPGGLLVTVADGQPDLKSSDWYLVRGLLSVPDGDSMPPAQLMAQTVYACAQPKCAEAEDAAAIVDRKLAAIQGAQ
jgi:hypothetical protein